VALACGVCDLRVEGHFGLNEFASLVGEDLHLLRIFVHTEGRIREMESALGLSYPTIKNRLSDLRAKLAAPAPPLPPAPPPPTDRPTAAEEVTGLLDALETGQISGDQAIDRLRSQPR
jgi:hypothetical protein